MAHFAQLENNTVIRVIVIGNDDIMDANGNESEAIGQAFCQQFGEGTYVQTSYNGKIRKHYAAIGFTFDEVRDAFVPPKPFASWVLNEALVLWEAPIPYPEEGNYLFKWDEDTLCWIETDIPKRT